eukprot:CAMPEP_0115836104 /NCGR_PEP_ID=MMETSP0287-20121206/4537_1 /TAXON_ID=412157 /ORGANISM="Chrysochromulina rotalis, Strain UIO044" /LENGTH=72 /DNA_ID=CAMNT_0003289581 /DNA_START=582 /DNA_END=797 /DNA_ORIENTATION=-
MRDASRALQRVMRQSVPLKRTRADNVAVNHRAELGVFQKAPISITLAAALAAALAASLAASLAAALAAALAA